MPKGFPRPDEEQPKSLRPPAPGGSLMAYMERNFPTVATRVKQVKRHPTQDMRDSKQTRKEPTRSGRFP